MSDQKPTQLIEVLSLLKEREAVCGTELLGRYIPRYAAVIHKLRRRGYLIETRPCSRGHQHESSQIEYRLAAAPDTDPDIIETEAEDPAPAYTDDGRLFGLESEPISQAGPKPWLET